MSDTSGTGVRSFVRAVTGHPARTLLIAMLFYKFCCYCIYAWAVIHAPFEVDYGEGIVWQQAAMIPGPKMYGDINTYPFIVFHYPPLYHMVVRAASALTHVDMLMTGRAVSVLCTLVIAGLIAAIVSLSLRQSSASDRRASALIAGLLPFSLPSIVLWSISMRVDMLAVALAFAGLYMAVRALDRPRRLYGAMPFFVAAVFAKQTCIAEFVSVAGIFMLRAPRTMLAAAALAGLGGMIVLAGFLYATDGRFLLHLVAYNVNRLSFSHGMFMLTKSMLTLPAMLIVLVAAYLYRIGVFSRRMGAVALETVRGGNDSAVMPLMLVSFGINTLFLSMLFKSGSNVNYFIEWYCVQCVLAGLLMAANTPLVFIAQVILALKILSMPTPLHAPATSLESSGQGYLLAMFKQMPGPILSDNMVLLMKAGKQVPYEPSIFAELGSRGKWDEHRITGLLDAHFFDAVLTYHGPGNFWFEERYLPDTVTAMLRDYPCVQSYGDFRLRTAKPLIDPRKPDAPPACEPESREPPIAGGN